MRNSRQLRMVRKLDAALAQRMAQRRARAEEIQRLIKSLPTNPDGTFMLPRNEAESAAHTRLMIAQAGLPLVDISDAATSVNPGFLPDCRAYRCERLRRI